MNYTIKCYLSANLERMSKEIGLTSRFLLESGVSGTVVAIHVYKVEFEEPGCETFKVKQWYLDVDRKASMLYDAIDKHLSVLGFGISERRREQRAWAKELKRQGGREIAPSVSQFLASAVASAYVAAYQGDQYCFSVAYHASRAVGDRFAVERSGLTVSQVTPS